MHRRYSLKQLEKLHKASSLIHFKCKPKALKWLPQQHLGTKLLLYLFTYQKITDNQCLAVFQISHIWPMGLFHPC